MNTKDFMTKAIVRAVRTMAQVALSMVSIGMAIKEVDWGTMVSVALVAGIYSLLTSVVTGLPEAKIDGELLIDDSTGSPNWTFKLDTDPGKLANMDMISFKVNEDSMKKLCETCNEEEE